MLSESGSDNISELPSPGFCMEVDCLYICYLNRYRAPWSCLPVQHLSPFSRRSPISFWEHPLLILCPLFARVNPGKHRPRERWRKHTLLLFAPPSHLDQSDLKSPNLMISPRTLTLGQVPRREELVGAHLFWWLILQTVSATNPCCLAHWSSLLCLSLVTQPSARSLSC